MTEPPHLSDEQVARFRERTFSPADLLELDTHLSACPACRDRLDSHGLVSQGVVSLRADLSGHLDYARTVACASGSPTPADDEHLRICPTCRAEVADLREFQAHLETTPRRAVVTPIRARRSWWVPMTAAAAIAAVGLGVWSMRHAATPAPAPVAVVQPVEAPLTDSQKQVLQLATAEGKLEPAPILNRLVTHQGTLLGPGAEAQRFDLTAPQGTAVMDDRPTFRWTALAGAQSYVVAVFDDNFESVAASPAVTGTEWQPDRPLPRGRVLNWQVTAKVGGASVHAPVPPAPEARFSVVSAGAQSEIEAARRDHPNNHLLLAALYAKAGAVEDAARELDAMDPAAAQPYRDSLKKLR